MLVVSQLMKEKMLVSFFFSFCFPLQGEFPNWTNRKNSLCCILSESWSSPLCRAMGDIFGTFYDVNMTPRWNVNLEHHIIKSLWGISEQRTLFGSTTQRNSKKTPNAFTFLHNSLRLIQRTKHRTCHRIWCNVATFFEKKLLKNSAQIKIQEIGLYMNKYLVLWHFKTWGFFQNERI